MECGFYVNAAPRVQTVRRGPLRRRLREEGLFGRKGTTFVREVPSIHGGEFQKVHWRGICGLRDLGKSVEDFVGKDRSRCSTTCTPRFVGSMGYWERSKSSGPTSSSNRWIWVSSVGWVARQYSWVTT